jgi:hypothetical protein
MVSSVIVDANVADRVHCGAGLGEQPGRQAGCMSENQLSVDSCCGRWGPTAFEPCLQQLICRRPMIPDGDRRHHSESGRVVYQPKPAHVWHEDIVAELVLRHYSRRGDRRVVRGQPIDGMLDGAL